MHRRGGHAWGERWICEARRTLPCKAAPAPPPRPALPLPNYGLTLEQGVVRQRLKQSCDQLRRQLGTLPQRLRGRRRGGRQGAGGMREA